jgi:hypothetical protein
MIRTIEETGQVYADFEKKIMTAMSQKDTTN